MAEKDGIRYRRVSTRMWGDEKFLDLSGPKPNARDLFIWLLTGPCTSLVPGIVLTTLSGISERLEWPAAPTRACWDEIVAAGMATAEWSRQLIWLPNALKHNPPANPNIVKSWRKFFDVHPVPECALRRTAEANIESFLQDFKPAFREAFLNPSRKPFGIQDQEQDQEYKDPPNPPAGAGGRFTRRELQLAAEDRTAYQRAQPAWVAPTQREAGREYPEPRTCPHEPQCEDREVCLRLFALDRRRQLTAALAEVAS